MSFLEAFASFLGGGGVASQWGAPKRSDESVTAVASVATDVVMHEESPRPTKVDFPTKMAPKAALAQSDDIDPDDLPLEKPTSFAEFSACVRNFLRTRDGAHCEAIDERTVVCVCGRRVRICSAFFWRYLIQKPQVLEGKIIQRGHWFTCNVVKEKVSVIRPHVIEEETLRKSFLRPQDLPDSESLLKHFRGDPDHRRRRIKRPFELMHEGIANLNGEIDRKRARAEVACNDFMKGRVEGDVLIQDRPCYKTTRRLTLMCHLCMHLSTKQEENDNEVTLCDTGCAFYDFRKLKVTNEDVKVNGYLDPHVDAQNVDLELWRSKNNSAREDLSVEKIKYVLQLIGEQFCRIALQEQNCVGVNGSVSKQVHWKPSVKGVRELCDCCKTSIFNHHWMCDRCGITICIDCYQVRQKASSPPRKRHVDSKRDAYSWPLCKDGEQHDQLMMVQVIPGHCMTELALEMHSKQEEMELGPLCHNVQESETIFVPRRAGKPEETMNKYFMCAICPETGFRWQSDLHKHYVFRHFNNAIAKEIPTDYPNKCPRCSYVAKTRTSMALHVGVTHRAVLTHLERIEAQKKSLNLKDSNIEEEEEKEDEKEDASSALQIFECPMCPMKISFDQAWGHLCLHFNDQLLAQLSSDSLKCSECDYEAPNKATLVRHYGGSPHYKVMGLFKAHIASKGMDEAKFVDFFRPAEMVPRKACEARRRKSELHRKSSDQFSGFQMSSQESIRNQIKTQKPKSVFDGQKSDYDASFQLQSSPTENFSYAKSHEQNSSNTTNLDMHSLKRAFSDDARFVKCQRCDYRYFSRLDLCRHFVDNHLKVKLEAFSKDHLPHKSDKLLCPMCGQEFDELQRLKRHYAWSHTDLEGLVLQDFNVRLSLFAPTTRDLEIIHQRDSTNETNLAFKEITDLVALPIRREVDVHGTLSECELCGESFSGLNRIIDKNVHILGHFRDSIKKEMELSTDNNRNCSECGYQAKDEMDMFEHRGLSHKIVYKFVQEELGSDNWNLDRGILHQCKICEAVFLSARALNEHYCSKHFYEHIVGHVRQIAPFDCHKCNFRCKSLTSLVHHFGTKHGILKRILGDNMPRGKSAFATPKRPIQHHSKDAPRGFHLSHQHSSYTADGPHMEYAGQPGSDQKARSYPSAEKSSSRTNSGFIGQQNQCAQTESYQTQNHRNSSNRRKSSAPLHRGRKLKRKQLNLPKESVQAPRECPVCRAKFVLPHVFIKHICDKHLGDYLLNLVPKREPFACVTCTSFVSEDAKGLIRHMGVEHQQALHFLKSYIPNGNDLALTEEGILPHFAVKSRGGDLCSFCKPPIVFSTPYLLQRHFADTHLRDKLYDMNKEAWQSRGIMDPKIETKCNVCNLEMKNKCSLVRHMGMKHKLVHKLALEGLLGPEQQQAAMNSESSSTSNENCQLSQGAVTSSQNDGNHSRSRPHVPATTIATISSYQDYDAQQRFQMQHQQSHSIGQNFNQSFQFNNQQPTTAVSRRQTTSTPLDFSSNAPSQSSRQQGSNTSMTHFVNNAYNQHAQNQLNLQQQLAFQQHSSYSQQVAHNNGQVNQAHQLNAAASIYGRMQNSGYGHQSSSASSQSSSFDASRSNKDISRPKQSIASRENYFIEPADPGEEGPFIIKCKSCESYSKTRCDFLRHVSDRHFRQELCRELPTQPPFACPVPNCKYVGNANSLVPLIKHYGSTHNMALRFINGVMAKYIPINAKPVRPEKNTKVTAGPTLQKCPFCEKSLPSNQYNQHLCDVHLRDYLDPYLSTQPPFKCPAPGCLFVAADGKDRVIAHYAVSHLLNHKNTHEPSYSNAWGAAANYLPQFSQMLLQVDGAFDPEENGDINNEVPTADGGSAMTSAPVNLSTAVEAASSEACDAILSNKEHMKTSIEVVKSETVIGARSQVIFAADNENNCLATEVVMKTEENEIPRTETPVRLYPLSEASLRPSEQTLAKKRNKPKANTPCELCGKLFPGNHRKSHHVVQHFRVELLADLKTDSDNETLLCPIDDCGFATKRKEDWIRHYGVVHKVVHRFVKEFVDGHRAPTEKVVIKKSKKKRINKNSETTKKASNSNSSTTTQTTSTVTNTIAQVNSEPPLQVSTAPSLVTDGQRNYTTFLPKESLSQILNTAFQQQSNRDRDYGVVTVANNQGGVATASHSIYPSASHELMEEALASRNYPRTAVQVSARQPGSQLGGVMHPYYVCREGPIFSSDELPRHHMGRFHLTSAGEKQLEVLSNDDVEASLVTMDDKIEFFTTTAPQANANDANDSVTLPHRPTQSQSQSASSAGSGTKRQFLSSSRPCELCSFYPTTKNKSRERMHHYATKHFKHLIEKELKPDQKHQCPRCDFVGKNRRVTVDHFLGRHKVIDEYLREVRNNKNVLVPTTTAPPSKSTKRKSKAKATATTVATVPTTTTTSVVAANTNSAPSNQPLPLTFPPLPSFVTSAIEEQNQKTTALIVQGQGPSQMLLTVPHQQSQSYHHQTQQQAQPTYAYTLQQFQQQQQQHVSFTASPTSAASTAHGHLPHLQGHQDAPTLETIKVTLQSPLKIEEIQTAAGEGSKDFVRVIPQFDGFADFEDSEHQEEINGNGIVEVGQKRLAVSSTICPICKEHVKRKNFHLATKHFRDKLRERLPHSSPFLCPECGLHAENRMQLWMHFLTKHGYVQRWLQETTESSNDVKPVSNEEHFSAARRHAKTAFWCDICQRRIAHITRLSHLATHHFGDQLLEWLAANGAEDEYTCPVCQLKLKTSLKVKVHALGQHGLADEWTRVELEKMFQAHVNHSCNNKENREWTKHSQKESCDTLRSCHGGMSMLGHHLKSVLKDADLTFTSLSFNEAREVDFKKVFKRSIEEPVDDGRNLKKHQGVPCRCLKSVTSLTSGAPHQWLCDGKLLVLNEPRDKRNDELFRAQWVRGQPVLVRNTTRGMNISQLWSPEAFCREFGHLKHDIVNTLNGEVLHEMELSSFWAGFQDTVSQMLDEQGRPMLLKLKDFPPDNDFASYLPRHFQDLMKNLPLPDYTGREGPLNMSSYLPGHFARPDLGPKLYIAYGNMNNMESGTTNLHIDTSDACNLMVHATLTQDEARSEQQAFRILDESGCDVLTREQIRAQKKVIGAIWHIFHPRDADKIRDLLNRVTLQRGQKLLANTDPIHDQAVYLDQSLRKRLYEEYGVESYAVPQCVGDTIFIPAGAPHQVRNIYSCIKVAEDFVSPENLAWCFHQTEEFRHLSEGHTNHEDKLQIKNILYHTVKECVSFLRGFQREQITSRTAIKKVNEEEEDEGDYEEEEEEEDDVFEDENSSPLITTTTTD